MYQLHSFDCYSISATPLMIIRLSSINIQVKLKESMVMKLEGKWEWKMIINVCFSFLLRDRTCYIEECVH